MMENEMDKCDHYWIPNSGNGGEPEYKLNSTLRLDEPVMHVKCSQCGCRTWFTKKQWHSIPVTSQPKSKQ